MPTAKPKLVPPDVFMRVRPVTDVGGHAQTGQPEASKKLHGWTDDSVTVGWSCANATDMGHALAVGSGEVHSYPKRVLGPEVTQDDVYTATMPALIDKLLGQNGQKPTDTMYFAYGQTGTGKSHTMLGTDGSLNAAPPADGGVHPDWGLFPRAVYDVFRRLDGEGADYMITVKVAEFYLMAGNDLLMANKPLAITDDNELVGLTEVVLDAPQDVLNLLLKARRRRHTRSTAMNIAGGGGDSKSEHTGSSRGHAAFILNVYRVLDTAAGSVLKTSFSLLDLAGAERPDKVGVKRMSGIEAGMEIERCWKKDQEPSMAAQTIFINFELYCIGETVVTATEGNKQNPTKGYRVKPMFSSACVRFIGSAFGGRCGLAIMVTLSQAPACGWETWFSCRYGKDLSKLRAPVRAKTPFVLKKAIAQAKAEVATQDAVLAGLTGKQRETRIAWLRFSIKTTAQQDLNVYRRLCDRFPGLVKDAKGTFDVPEAVSLGYTCPRGSIPAYPLTGEWDPASLTDFLENEAAFSDVENFKLFLRMPLKDQRKMVDSAVIDMTGAVQNRAWASRVDPELVTINTTPYPPCDNTALKAYVTPPEGCRKGDTAAPRACVVYCHGGAAVYCNPKHFHSIAARYAVENDVVVVSLQYRLCPDTKAPGALYDLAGAVCAIYDAGSIGGYAIDKTRIATTGDSGGAWPALGGVLELVRRGEAHRVRLVVPNCPMISDILMKSTHRVEGAPRCATEWNWETDMLTPKGDPAYAPGGKHHWHVWLNHAPKDLLAGLPKVAFITSEFDYLRRMAEDVAMRIEATGSEGVVEFVVHPGHAHAWHGIFTHRNIDMYYEDFGKILAKHLLS